VREKGQESDVKSIGVTFRSLSKFNIATTIRKEGNVKRLKIERCQEWDS
jgi:hypothetical protein